MRKKINASTGPVSRRPARGKPLIRWTVRAVLVAAAVAALEVLLSLPAGAVRVVAAVADALVPAGVLVPPGG